MKSFQDVCMDILQNKEFMYHWNRLTGNSLAVNRSPIITAIDQACGYNPDEKAMPEFVDFIYEYIWLPVSQIPGAMVEMTDEEILYSITNL